MESRRLKVFLTPLTVLSNSAAVEQVTVACIATGKPELSWRRHVRPARQLPAARCADLASSGLSVLSCLPPSQN